MPIRVADTIARLATATRIYVIGPDGKKRTIGAIENYTENETRESVPRYEMDADNPGDTVERTPGVVARTMTINRAVLYDSDGVMAAFGFRNRAGDGPSDDVIDQITAVEIEKHEFYKGTDETKVKITTHHKCWVHGNPRTYNITGANLRIIQNVTIGYATKDVNWSSYPTLTVG